MKGILFKPEVWKAKQVVLDQYGEAQTRRVIKLKGYSREVWDRCIPHNGGDAELLGEPYLKVPYDPITDNAGARIIARYHVGETVYIKEAWRVMYVDDNYPISDLSPQDSCLVQYKDSSPSPTDCIMGKWRSPLFMPEWAARHLITITDVRAERLQEIKGQDCLAEGVDPCTYQGYTESYKNNDYLVGHFATLWNSINPKYPWESNPWVFPYTFRRYNEREDSEVVKAV